MKKFVLSIAILALMASPVLAQTDAFGVYQDQTGLNCNITMTFPALNEVWIVHKTSAGATGSQFKVTAPTSGTLTAAGGGVANANFLVIGEPYTDLSLAYTECLTGTFPVWKLSFFASAAVPDCQYISIIPAPDKVGVLSVDCTFAELPSYGGQGIISATAACNCDVATQESTWGKVKSLYR